jgi:hypothetical protein
MNQKAKAKDTEIIDEVIPQDVSPKEQISVLVADVKKLLNAEIEYYQARFAYSQKIAKRTALLGALTLVSVFCAAVALVVGLLFIVSAYFGVVVGAIAVISAFVLIAFTCAVLTRQSAKHLSFPEVREGEVNE